MKTVLHFFIATCFVHLAQAQMERAVKFLQDYDNNYSPLFAEQAEAMFQKATNITTENSKKQIEADQKIRRKLHALRDSAREVNLTDVDPRVQRQFKLIFSTMSTSNSTVAREITEIGTEMEDIYSTGRIVNDPMIIKSLETDDNPDVLTLNAHLIEVMGKSNDLEELKYVWKSWRDATGPKLRRRYSDYVRLSNIGARENGFRDAGDYKRKRYEVDDLESRVDVFMNELKPIYQEVHAYARFHLAKQYPGIIGDDGLIPAHVVGNMWAQHWEQIYPKMIPYPEEPPIDVTPKLKQSYSIEHMFKTAESFFVSIGWPTLPAKFWTHSLLVQPKDRKVECHASAWDFVVTDKGQPDVRVKMCAKKTQEDFITIHHELGHIYYDLLYWNQSLEYRGGANPGFHEAVGDTIVLSAYTPAHLNAIGLLDKVSDSKEADINFLLKVALERISFIPYAYVMDKWMWHVYGGEIEISEMNEKWWNYRQKYQGLKPPIARTEDDFDPGAKYHIPGDTPYIRYFFSYILQFAFHKQACNLSGNTGPLHRCSIYKSLEAGKGLGDMLALGKSRPWPEALQQFLGTDTITTQPIKEYFEPLIRWLQDYRNQHNYTLGWDEDISLSSSSVKQWKYSNTIVTCLCFLVSLMWR